MKKRDGAESDTLKYQTSSRKKEHLFICAQKAVESGESGFADIQLVHNALPECSMDAIDLSARFLGKNLKSPVFIAAMTGGHPDTLEVNKNLARAAQKYGLGMGVGSQRAALENPDFAESFTIVRDEAPDAFLCANLGAVQLRDHGPEWADRSVEMIDADALCVHLNPMQEAIQPEGDHDTSGCLAAIAELCESSRYPVIVKETGCGISAEAAEKLWASGVSALDVGGLGGTSWAAVELVRADTPALRRLGEHFADWGIPTALSVLEAQQGDGPVIATGGLRSGTDVAKAIALGATLSGMALPFLAPAMEHAEALDATIEQIHKELRVAMYCTGAKNLQELKRIRYYMTGRLAAMVRPR